jgi:endonuclease/exonuclease/phosphatase family metal-dependent hydrolase
MCALVATAAALAAGAGSASAATVAPTITVMTHNLYFGADLTPVLVATDGTSFALAVAAAYDNAQATDFAGRARAWAAEIAAAQPDIVALNEAAVWQLQGNETANFVDLLTAALAARGLSYSPASESTGYDVAAPGLFSTGLLTVRLVQHEVVLVRNEPSLKVLGHATGQYSAVDTLRTVGGPVYLPWSWASADVMFKGHALRFATTHLDPNPAFTNEVPNQNLQAAEFMAGPGSTSLPLIWAGDFNSNAYATTITGVPPNTSTYHDLLAAGLTDAWTAVHPDLTGYTCCHDQFLRSGGLDERIDYVFERGGFTPLAASVSTASTAGGLFDSDHAGVVATFRLPD